MLVIPTEDTRYTGSVLSYEIEQAIDNYKIPLIIAYPGYSAILNVDALSNLWPKALADRINKSGTSNTYCFHKGLYFGRNHTVSCQWKTLKQR